MNTIIISIELLNKLVWPLLATALAALLLLLGKKIFSLFESRITELSTDKIDIRFRELQETIEKTRDKSKAEEIIEEKRNRFLNIPSISFHFADKERIKNFYNDYFREPTVENLVSEIATEASGDLKGTLPKVFEARIGGRDLTKWISTIKLPETSINGMFRRYQRETIKNDQVTLGLEVVDIEVSEVNRFDSLVDNLRKDFQFTIDETVLNERRAAINEKAAERTLRKLERASGLVLVEGTFIISESNGEFYRLIYEHPVSSYVIDSQGGRP